MVVVVVGVVPDEVVAAAADTTVQTLCEWQKNLLGCCCCFRFCHHASKRHRDFSTMAVTPRSLAAAATGKLAPPSGAFPSAQTSARPRAKALYAPTPDGDAPDFLSLLEDAEARDTERLSSRSSNNVVSPPPSRRPTPPLLPIGDHAPVRDGGKASGRKSSSRTPSGAPLPLADDPRSIATRIVWKETNARSKET